MTYLSQFAWILLFSFLGEGLHILLPVPIPASIYGLVLLFLALACKVISLDRIRETGHFLVNIMAVLFVSPTVGLIASWELVREKLLPIGTIIVLTLVLTFWVSGAVTQWLMRKGENHA